MKFYYINPGGGVALFPEEGIPFRDGGHLPTPCRKEHQTMLKFIHFKNNHIKKIVMSQAFIKKGYYWSGFTEDIKEIINNCGKCLCESNIEKIPHRLK